MFQIGTSFTKSLSTTAFSFNKIKTLVHSYFLPPQTHSLTLYVEIVCSNDYLGLVMWFICFLPLWCEGVGGRRDLPLARYTWSISLNSPFRKSLRTMNLLSSFMFEKALCCISTMCLCGGRILGSKSAFLRFLSVLLCCILFFFF